MGVGGIIMLKLDLCTLYFTQDSKYRKLYLFVLEYISS